MATNEKPKVEEGWGPPTRVLLLNEEVYNHLVYVFEKHVRTGLGSSDELPIAMETSAALRRAQRIDYSKLGNAASVELKPGGVNVNLDPAPANPD